MSGCISSTFNTCLKSYLPHYMYELLSHTVNVWVYISHITCLRLYLPYYIYGFISHTLHYMSGFISHITCLSLCLLYYMSDILSSILHVYITRYINIFVNNSRHYDYHNIFGESDLIFWASITNILSF